MEEAVLQVEGVRQVEEALGELLLVAVGAEEEVPVAVHVAVEAMPKRSARSLNAQSKTCLSITAMASRNVIKRVKTKTEVLLSKGLMVPSASTEIRKSVPSVRTRTASVAAEVDVDVEEIVADAEEIAAEAVAEEVEAAQTAVKTALTVATEVDVEVQIAAEAVTLVAEAALTAVQRP